MKESRFIEQNKENWIAFEENLRFKNRRVSRLSRLFVQITDDLSYARTFYKNRAVKVYLNGIAQVLFNELYRNKTGNLQSFINFWKKELPQQIHESRVEFRISFLIFTVAFAIGILSSFYDKDFPRLILGQEYIDMTMENINNNDPMAVYKKAHETTMFASITINNLMVATLTFVFGIFLSFGTIIILIRNAIMVGGFQYFFIEKGLFAESFLTIWQHGTLEISCIIIAGAAGLTLGKGLIFPGTFSRIDAFKISAMRGLKIFTGIAPIIILAAFIESFVTRHTDLHPAIRVSVITLSLSFVLLYFVWYPWYFAKKNKAVQHKENLKFSKKEDFNFHKILSQNEILGHVVSLAKKNILLLFSLVIAISLFHSVIIVIYEAVTGGYYSNLNTYRNTAESYFFVNTKLVQYIAGVITLGFIQIILCLKGRRMLIMAGFVELKTNYLSLVINSIIISSLILFAFSFGFQWGFLSLMLFGPFAFLTIFISFLERIHLLTAALRLYDILDKSWKKLYFNSVQILLFITVLFLMMNTQIAGHIIQGIYLNFNYSSETMYLIQIFITTILGTSLMALFCILLVASSIFTYSSILETISAQYLKKRIEKFGERNNLYGFEKE